VSVIKIREKNALSTCIIPNKCAQRVCTGFNTTNSMLWISVYFFFVNLAKVEEVQLGTTYFTVEIEGNTSDYSLRSEI